MAFEGETLIYCHTLAYSDIPPSAGVGPVLPISITVDVPGVYDVADYPVPAGQDVVIELWGAGGGGGGQADGGPAGGGGGGGAYVRATIPAATWAAGGTLTIGGGGTAGSGEGVDGTGGDDTELAITVPGPLIAGGGGAGLATAGAGGVGGDVTNTGGYALQFSRSGGDGGTGLDNPAFTGGAGGAAGASPFGAGGRGANYPALPPPAVAAVAGGDGAARLTFLPA